MLQHGPMFTRITSLQVPKQLNYPARRHLALPPSSAWLRRTIEHLNHADFLRASACGTRWLVLHEGGTLRSVLLATRRWPPSARRSAAVRSLLLMCGIRLLLTIRTISRRRGAVSMAVAAGVEGRTVLLLDGGMRVERLLRREDRWNVANGTLLFLLALVVFMRGLVLRHPAAEARGTG